MRAAEGRGGSCKIISMEESGALQRQKIEEWLKKKMVDQYGADDAIDNPLIRICVMFDSLNFDAQLELCSFAKGRIFGIGKNLSLRDRFWCILEKGGNRDGSWKDIEEFAVQLICKENIRVKAPEWCGRGRKGIRKA